MFYATKYQNDLEEANYLKIGETCQMDRRLSQIFTEFEGLTERWWGVLSTASSTQKGLDSVQLETSAKAAFSEWMYPVAYNHVRSRRGYCHEVFKNIPKLRWCRVMATASRLAKKAKNVSYSDTVSYFFDEMSSTSKEEMAIQHKKLSAFDEYQSQGRYRINHNGFSREGWGSGTVHKELPTFQNESWKKIVAS
tara:strand:- start:163 stop:744 length:582 start_codon:yes stop_codon:yes gene_type:complete